MKKNQNAPRLSEHPPVMGEKNVLKKNQSASRPSEHPPVMGGKNVVDSHVQRIVLATKETTVTQQVSHRPIECQSRLWSQRGTKVNGLYHGDNPLLRPTGIQIATKSYATLQAMAPTNIKTVYQTSLLYIMESNPDRLGLLSPTHDQRSQQPTGPITLQPVLINKSKFLKATHCRKIRKLKYRGPWRWSRRATSNLQSPVHP